MSNQDSLTIDQANDIRSAYLRGITEQDLAVEYGVHRGVIQWLTGRRAVRHHPDLVEYSAEEIGDIMQRGIDGYSAREIAAQYGLQPDNKYSLNQIYGIIHRRRRYRLYPVPEKWEPSCMSAAEYDDWESMMKTMTQPVNRVPRPCDDCHLPFAIANRALGTCNGTLPGERLR